MYCSVGFQALWWNKILTHNLYLSLIGIFLSTRCTWLVSICMCAVLLAWFSKVHTFVDVLLCVQCTCTCGNFPPHFVSLSTIHVWFWSQFFWYSCILLIKEACTVQRVLLKNCFLFHFFYCSFPVLFFLSSVFLSLFSSPDCLIYLLLFVLLTVGLEVPAWQRPSIWWVVMSEFHNLRRMIEHGTKMRLSFSGGPHALVSMVYVECW